MNSSDLRESILGLPKKMIEPTDWLLIDQDRINQFADATLDHQFIHVDPEVAAQTPFGGTIAHGFLSLSLLSYFAGEAKLVPDGLTMAINYGMEAVRFLAPVPVNARVRGTFKVAKVSEKRPGQFLMTSRATVEIENSDRPALIADWLTLLVTEQG